MNEQHRERINQAVQQAFNTSWEMVESLAGGLSTSNLYKISVGERDLVARVSEPDHVHNYLEREFTAMKAAAEQKIAPAVHFADPKLGVLLMDFVIDQSIYAFNLEDPQRFTELAQFIYKMHQLPTLPADQSIAEKLDGLFTLCIPEVQSNVLVQQCMALNDELAWLFAVEDDKRPCHCDINPTNILYDGNQLWLIDWASASQQSFYFDLACTCSFLFYRDEQTSDEFLQAYLQRTPTTDEADKFYRMRQFVRVYYGLIFVYLGTKNEPVLLSQTEVDELPSYPQFMQMLGEGKENLAFAKSRQKMGFIQLKTALAKN